MSSYEIIIADDEPMIRKGLVSTIPWEELGFRVAAVCVDGQDVIDYLKEQEVDVVFTDVQMCQVGGLEVTRWIRQHGLATKVVMISGFKEFEYIKEAMQLDVRDYILKPLDPAEIKKVFRKIRLELDEATKEQGRNMTALLSYREDAGCIQVMNAQNVAVDALLGGNDGEFTKYGRQWRMAINEVKKEYVPLLVLSMIDAVYNRMEQSGIVLSGELSKEKIIRRIGVAAVEDIQGEMKEILKEIFEGIKCKKSTEKESVITKARRYIEEHLNENLGVDELAAYVYLNRSYFSREFKLETGETVADYIIKRRMEKAIELIKVGYSSEKIAAILGYTDVKYFQKVFKRHTGYTVREYRNLMR